jgi:hypothetical protein
LVFTERQSTSGRRKKNFVGICHQSSSQFHCV